MHYAIESMSDTYPPIIDQVPKRAGVACVLAFYPFDWGLASKEVVKVSLV